MRSTLEHPIYGMISQYSVPLIRYGLIVKRLLGRKEPALHDTMAILIQFSLCLIILEQRVALLHLVENSVSTKMQRYDNVIEAGSQCLFLVTNLEISSYDVHSEPLKESNKKLSQG